MPYGLYISSEGAHYQAKRMEVIANNLANVDTVGFKRQLSLSQARYAQAVEEGLAAAGSGSVNDVGGGVMMFSTATDFSQGKLERTGSATDFALRGEGFFVVRRGEEHLLTRAGNFVLNERGELVTQDGDPVLSDAGSPVIVGRPWEPFDVTPRGEIRQGGDTQPLAIAKMPPPEELTRVGENLFRPLSEPQPLEAEHRQVVGGFREASGVVPTTEMVEMIETSRLLEANMRLLQAQDEMLGNLIGRLMRVS